MAYFIISKLNTATFIYLTPPIAIGYKSCCGNFSHTDIERIEGIGAVGTVFEKVFFWFRLFSPKKVQMKRSVTGDDADGYCPQRKSPCPTLVGRKTKALSIKVDSDGVHVNMFIQ